MKKNLILLLAISIFSLNNVVFATEALTSDVVHDDAPKWEEYVAPKYRNPHATCEKDPAVKQLVWGVVLTELIITCPIGIPMTISGTKKVKMLSYENRKKIFDEEISKAQLIQDDAQRKAEYKRILSKCHLKESTRRHYAKKEGRVLAN